MFLGFTTRNNYKYIIAYGTCSYIFIKNYDNINYCEYMNKKLKNILLSYNQPPNTSDTSDT
jgi:hypothetical protein